MGSNPYGGIPVFGGYNSADGTCPDVDVLVLRRKSSALYRPPLLLLVERLVVDVVDMPILIRLMIPSVDPFLYARADLGF